MDTLERLNHSVWDSKDHVVFIPKYRRKAFYGMLRSYLGEVFQAPTLTFQADGTS
jgi:putative transposase